MSDVSDIARIEYVLQNYDKVTFDGKTSRNLNNTDGTKAKAIQYEKRINGVYYVAQALLETSKKQLIILSAYKNKAK